MSWDCLSHVQRFYDGSQGETLLAMALARCAEDDGSEIRPAIATMAALARCTERSVHRYLRDMCDDGWLELVQPATNLKPAIYRINPLWMRACNLAIGAEQRRRGRRPLPLRMTLPADWRDPEFSGDDMLSPQTPTARRDDTKSPQESQARGDAKSPPRQRTRGDTVSPQTGELGVTPCQSRGDIVSTPYIGDSTLDSSPLPPEGGECGFDALFAQYPVRRRDLKQARREWAKLQPDEALQARIVAAAKQQSTWPEWQAEQGKRVPNLSKWLRDQRWRATHDKEAPAARTAVTQEAGTPAAPPPATPGVRAAHLAKLREQRQAFAAKASTSARSQEARP